MAGRVRRGRAKLNFVEVVVLVGVACCLLGLLIPPTGPPPPRTDADLDFTSWDPEAESKALPPAEIVVSDTDITGEWLCRGRHLSLKIERASAVTGWKIAFYSGTRCALGQSIQLTRTGTYKDGLLLLNQPVQTLSGKNFQRVYTVQIRGKERLVPSVYLPELREILGDADELDWKFFIRFEQQDH
jgi:hypothetical protein